MREMLTWTKPRRAPRQRRAAPAAGFTLIEMLIVISIIGLLAALIAPRLLGHFTAAKRTKAMADIKILSAAIELYAIDNNKPPTTEQGIRALVEKPIQEPVPARWREGGYLKQRLPPKDPWGNEYIYLSPGLHDPEFDILCYGSDGAAGGASDAADIESWDLQGEGAVK